jgi:hypothetical protein
MITCQNNGICTNNGNVYSCKCVDNFYGSNCQFQYLPLNSTTFINSTILTQERGISLLNLIRVPFYSRATRVYQASKDGFGARDFHSKVDGILGTLTVVKSTYGNIFGGFTSLSWGLPSEYYSDPSAYIFSLVNQQNNYSYIFNQISTYQSNPFYSIYTNPLSGPSFGGSHDFGISDQSNSKNNSFSRLGYSYQAPLNYTFSSDQANSFLAGSRNFQTLEVEVYTIISIYNISFI